jgi:hypothetical protein
VEILLAWAAYLTLSVSWLALGWAWLAPRLPRRVRLVSIGLLAGGAVLALIVAAQIPHDYRPTDLPELDRAGVALFIQLLIAVVGVVAALAALGRRRVQTAGLCGVGAYLAGVGVVLYWMLGGESSFQSPCLLLVGTAIGLGAIGSLARLPRQLAIAVGLASGLLAALEAEALRGTSMGSLGSGPGVASRDLLLLVAIEVTMVLLSGTLFVRNHKRLLAGTLRRAGLGLAGTGLVLVLRGLGEWLPGPDAGSTTLYGLPLTLLVVACSLGIVDLPTGARRGGGWSPGGARLRYAMPMWPLSVPLLFAFGLAVIWRPAPERCAQTSYAQSSWLTPAGPAWAASPNPAAPRRVPDVAAFGQRCLRRTATLSQIVYAIFPTCKWSQVDANYPLAQASGIVRAIDLSQADSPWLHTSHDVEFDVGVDPASAWLVLGDGGSNPLLHVESESAAFPVAYRPVVGDRVTVAGRWIFDCGHDAKTEIHPAAVIASEHDEWRTELAGGPQQVRTLRVWMNSAPGLVHVPLAPLDIQVAFPRPAISRGATPVVQVVAGSPSAARWTIDGSGPGPRAAVHLVPPAPDGSAYFELLFGYREVTPPPSPPISYTVAFDRLLVRNDLRQQARNTARILTGGIPTDLIDPQLGLPGTGHWFMQVLVGHTWRSLLDSARVESGHTYALAAVPPMSILAPSAEHLRLAITGYVNNDPSDGVELASGSVDGAALLNWDAGRLADLCCGQEQNFTLPHGAWTLSYHVNRAPP